MSEVLVCRDGYRDSAGGRISEPAMLPVRAAVFRVRHSAQPVPLPDPGPDARVRGVCSGGRGGVARGRVRLLLPPPQGPPHHGAPRRCRLPARLRLPPSLS